MCAKINNNNNDNNDNNNNNNSYIQSKKDLRAT